MNNASHEILITPKPKIFNISFQELWEKFDLVKMWARRDVVAGYKQTVLGPLWIVIQPLPSTFMFMMVFSYIGSISTNGKPPFLYYLSGIIAWNYFGSMQGKIADTFTANAAVFNKVYFPRLLVPIAGFISITVNSLAQFAFFFLVALYYAVFTTKVTLSWTILLSVPAMLQLGILGWSVGLIFSSFTAKYRDLSFLIATFMQLWFYGSPIIYPMSQVPAHWRKFFYLNPTAAPLEILHQSFANTEAVPLIYILLSVSVTAFLFLLGICLFQVTEKTFIDTV